MKVAKEPQIWLHTARDKSFTALKAKYESKNKPHREKTEGQENGAVEVQINPYLQSGAVHITR